MRGSDDSAAIYWLSRMLEGGEDPKFVARRLIIFASEDIGTGWLHSLYICEVYDVIINCLQFKKIILLK